MSVRITCIKKSNGYHSNPYTAIETLGWINESTNATGISTRLTIYNWIKDEHGVAYVTDYLGNKAFLITAISSSGNKYVKTVADETKTDNLLQLPECR
ncbi:MAG: DUF3892 domain-containing protein [Bacteroidetes bacterium]|nr:DUF3892 domain-containing protein [Bacteroidota bacterium]